MPVPLSRREVLQRCAALGLLVAGPSFGGPLADVFAEAEVGTRQPTPSNELGPFYRRGAPASTPPAAGFPPTALPSAPTRPAPPAGISAEALTRRIDEFLGSRGFKGEGGVRPEPTPRLEQAASDPTPLTFVCEEDVRLAIQAGRKLLVAERAIVTPAARDLGEDLLRSWSASILWPSVVRSGSSVRVVVVRTTWILGRPRDFAMKARWC